MMSRSSSSLSSSSTSSSSLSSSSSSEDLSQANLVVLESSTSTTSLAEPIARNQPGAVDVSTGMSSSSEESDNEYQDLTSTPSVCVGTHDSKEPSISPRQSPSIQLMNRSGADKSYRIPLVVFERSKSSTPIEWSLASNESLFSIHIGNTSFSRDRISTISELDCVEIPESKEFISISSNVPVQVVDSIRISELKNGEAIEVSDKPVAVKNATIVTFQNISEEKPLPPVKTYSNIFKVSEENLSKRHSYAFPMNILLFFCSKKKCAWPSCCCSSCSLAFCYCTCPSCYLRPESCCCSNCSWEFCYTWNPCQNRWCCCSSTILEDGVTCCHKKGKVHDENPQVVLQANSNTASGGCCQWLPSFCHWLTSCCDCLPSCSRCCSLNCWSLNCCSLNCWPLNCCSLKCCSLNKCSFRSGTCHCFSSGSCASCSSFLHRCFCC